MFMRRIYDVDGPRCRPGLLRDLNGPVDSLVAIIVMMLPDLKMFPDFFVNCCQCPPLAAPPHNAGVYAA
jgi:hypothetical protein